MIKIKFKPNLFLTLLAICGLVLFLCLGFWQLSRAQEKKQILENLRHKQAATAISLQQLSTDQKQRQYQPISFEGEFLNQQQFLLDNRTFKGQFGYEVITPVKVEGLQKLVLVNRGWIQGNKDRRILPHLKSVFGLQKIHGIIRIPLSKGILLKTEHLSAENWPIRIQQLDFKLMEQLLHQPVYPFVVLMNPGNTNGFKRQWTFINMLPEKHIGYAVQWFSFAFVLILIYLALTIKLEKP